MSPKFLTLHRFRAGQLLEDDHDTIMVNPRRVDYFAPVPPPTQQPALYCGTKVSLGSRQFVVVNETMDEIKRKLKK